MQIILLRCFLLANNYTIINDHFSRAILLCLLVSTCFFAALSVIFLDKLSLMRSVPSLVISRKPPHPSLHPFLFATISNPHFSNSSSPLLFDLIVRVNSFPKTFLLLKINDPRRKLQRAEVTASTKTMQTGSCKNDQLYEMAYEKFQDYPKPWTTPHPELHGNFQAAPKPRVISSFEAFRIFLGRLSKDRPENS